jgi:cellulose synthase operon protein C
MKIRNSRFLPLLLLPVLLLSCGALWQTDVASAVELARTGDYKSAAPLLEQAVNGGNYDATVVESLYYSWTRQGEYAKAKERFDAWAKANDKAGPIRLAAARLNRLTGSHPQALAHLNAILNYSDVGVAAQYEKGQVLEETGKRQESQAIYQQIIQNFQNGIMRAPANLIYVAGAMRATEYFHDANDVLKLATQADPRNAEAFVMWGELLEEKYNEPEAIASYQDALKIDPNLPEALLGVARTLSLTEPEKADVSLKKALDTNPNFADAHLLVASQQIDSETYDDAFPSIDKALAVNPQSTEAHSLLATIHFLRGKKAEFDAEVQKVLAINPLYNDLYYTLAEGSISLRLYAQAVAFAREALRLNPRDFRSMSLLGINLMRVGQEEEGKAVLEQAFEGDKFNVWTGNTLTLLDSFSNFDRIETPHFRVKLHKKESAALQPYVTDLLEKAYDTLSKKYDFTPEGPIIFEMFPDHGDFAVRALGLPGLGALGVCFGKFFVMDSPSARKPDEFNWGSTLWHEFAHVITLQITDHKVPRWFSEGLSVYEERKAFPGWGDDMKLPYLMAIKERKLLPIAELNDGFIRPKFPEQVLISYYQASLVADYIESKWGFPAIRKMLMSYKAGRTTPEVFKEALSLDLAQFDTEFLKFVNDKAAEIDVEQFKKLVTEGQEAIATDPDKAIASLTRAMQMYPEYVDEFNPYEPLAEAYLKKGDKAAATATLQKLMTYSETTYKSAVQLSDLLQERGDVAGSRRALDAAIYIRPLDIQAHEKLGSILLSQKQFADATREYETLLVLNAPDRAGTYYRLAEANLGAGKTQDARKNILKSLEIAPSYEAAQELLLKIVR